MAEIIVWIENTIKNDALPVPLVADLAQYQFATIHPYYDGNGRTARLLTTLILHKTGYGLKGIYSLEEYYARNLSGYYSALTVGESHNYSMGRKEADVTAFMEHFSQGMSAAFAAVQAQAASAAERGTRDRSPLLRQIDLRQRRLLTLFRTQGTATTKEIAQHLGLSPPAVVTLCRDWINEGFLEMRDPSRKDRAYRLAPSYEAALTENQQR